MKLDQENLKKHRFWIIFGIMVPLLLICMVMLSTAVAEDNQIKRVNLNSHKKLLETEAAKPELAGQQYENLLKAREQDLKKQKLSLWQQAYDMQKEIQTWPAELAGSIGTLKFLDEIPSRECNTYASGEVYPKQIEKLANFFKTKVQVGAEEVPIESVRFKGGPERALVYVKENPWKNRPSPTEVWLAQEDIWVQGELLRAIQEANLMVARFEKVDKGPDGKPYPTELDKARGDVARAHFLNPYWHLDLILTQKPASFVLRGAIQNRPDNRRQMPIGRNYYEVLLNKDAKPVILPIEGETLMPGQEWPIKEFTLPGLVNPEGLLGVTQLFEVRDAPVRQINEIELAKPSHRNASKRLLGSESAAAPPAAKGPPPKGKQPAADPRKGPAEKKTQLTDNGLVRDRWLDKTEEVRRLPFGIVVIVDQAHVPEVLTAIANSKLRVQVTQFGWQHFRDPLTSGEPSPASTRPGPPAPGGRPGIKGPSAAELPLPNLVELAVYGIASIYERSPEAAPAAETAKQ